MPPALRKRPVLPACAAAAPARLSPGSSTPALTRLAKAVSR
jgi:hypothetical protein